MYDYQLYLESTVLSAPHEFGPSQMYVTDQGDHWYEYNVAVPADNLTSSAGNEFWIIAAYKGYDYTNPLGELNIADTDTLTAFFRYDLEVSDENQCPPPFLYSIDPSYTEPGSVIPATIDGYEILYGPCLDVTLTTDGQDDIPGTEVTWVDNNQITCNFDLSGTVPGLWDVIVINGCCSEPGVGGITLAVMDPLELSIVSTGVLPDIQPYPDDKQFCVVGDDSYGHQGVYYFGPDYDLMYYPTDYSADGSLYMTLEGDVGFPLSTFAGEPVEMGPVEVDASGGVILATHGSGPGTENNVIWWMANTQIASNFLALNSVYGTAVSRDVEAALTSDGILWHFFGVEEDLVYEGDELGIIMAGINEPYGAADWATGWGLNWAPVDNEGSVDGLVSDMESYRLAIDTEPHSLVHDHDLILYFLEGLPDEPGIEIFSNSVSSLGVSQTYLATIDEGLQGLPVDISVLNTFGSSPFIPFNWLFVLEDNEDSTWQVAVFDQNGTFIERFEPPLNGTPLGLDCDNVNKLIHVWFLDETELKFAIFELI